MLIENIQNNEYQNVYENVYEDIQNNVYDMYAIDYNTNHIISDFASISNVMSYIILFYISVILFLFYTRY